MTNQIRIKENLLQSIERKYSNLVGLTAQEKVNLALAEFLGKDAVFEIFSGYLAET